MNAGNYDRALAGQWANAIAQTGSPKKTGELLGPYIAQVEKRFADLEKKLAELEKRLDDFQPGITVNGK